MWNRRDGGQMKEPPPAAPPQRGLHPEEVMLPMWWYGRESCRRCSLWKTSGIFATHAGPSDQLQAPSEGKSPRRGCKSFRMRRERTFLFGDPGKTVPAWPHSRDSSAVLTRNCTFAWPFSSVSRVSQWREISVPWKTAEGTWRSSLLLKVTVLWNDGMGSCLKDSRGQWNWMAMMLCSYNLGGKWKVCRSLHLTVKSEGTFQPRQ